MTKSTEPVATGPLVMRAQAGDQAALERLLTAAYPALLRRAYTTLRNHDAAEDVVQDTLIKISQRLGTLLNPNAFSKWAREILRRACVDHLRHESRHRQGRADLEAASEVAVVGSDMPEPSIETRLTVEKSLERLGRDSYEVVQLRFMIGLSLKEIATVTRIPVGTVKSRLHTARGQLRGLLAYNG